MTILPGDSGGPLIVNGKIIGLASWSRSDFKWYSVYARLTNDMGDWVAAEISNNNPPGEGKLTVRAGGTSRITVIAPFQRGTYPITITGGSLKTTYTLTVT